MTYHYLPPGGINKMAPFQKPHWFTDCRWPHYGSLWAHSHCHQFSLLCHLVPCNIPGTQHSPIPPLPHQSIGPLVRTIASFRHPPQASCAVDQYVSTATVWGQVSVKPQTLPHPPCRTIASSVCCCASFAPACTASTFCLFCYFFESLTKHDSCQDIVALTGSKAYGRWIWVKIYEQAIFVSLLGSAVHHHNVKKKSARSVCVWRIQIHLFAIYRLVGRKELRFT